MAVYLGENLVCSYGGTKNVSGDLDSAYVYVWEKYSLTKNIVEAEESDVLVSFQMTGNNSNDSFDYVDYSNEIKVVDENLSLVNPSNVLVNSQDAAELLLGKYVMLYGSNDLPYYRIPSTSTVTSEITSGSLYSSKSYVVSEAYKLTVGSSDVKGDYIENVCSDSNNTYPTDGEQSGYWYVYKGTLKDYSIDVQLEEKTVTPTKSIQEITADIGYDGLSKVTVDVIPSNYIEPTGTKNITSNGTVDVTEYASVNVNVSSSDSGATPTYQSKSVTPSESSQTVTPDNGYDALSSVIVNAISSTYVGSGITQKSATTYTPGTSNQTIASGTYLTGTQTISGDSNLIASNIKSGVSIFGVAGTYAGSGSSGSSMAMATGTTTSATIDTGLSSIDAIVIYKSSIAATGLVQGVYRANEAKLYYVYCSSYGSYVKACSTSSSTSCDVSGGTFTLGTSGTSGLSSNTTYNWIAFGQA